MATTSSTLAAGEADAERSGDGNGGPVNLRAKLALGIVALGCAAALAFGGLQARDAARTLSQPAGPVVAGAEQGTDQVAWLEQFQLAGRMVPGERHEASQVAWLEWFQHVEAGAPGVGAGSDEVAWLEQFQLTR